MEPNLFQKTIKPHIFLTGEIQVGKSFLINRVIADLGICPSGFRTLGDVFDADGSSAVRIYDAELHVPAENTIVAVRGPKCRQGFPEVFDTIGTALLKNPGELVLMDELGFFENDALQFQAAVLSILATDIPVLGVVKPRSTPFLDAVKNHPKTLLIEITRENRDSMYEVVRELVQKILE